MPPTTTPERDELKALLEEDIAIAKDNNRLLRLIRRDAVLGLVVKVIIWLVILGVPLFFLSTYLGPIMDALSGTPVNGEVVRPGVFGIPSKEQMEQLIQQYQAVYQ